MRSSGGDSHACPSGYSISNNRICSQGEYARRAAGSINSANDQRNDASERGDSDDDPLPYLYASDELKTITANPAGTNSERFVVLSVQLGLKASNTEESPPDDDITDKLGENAEVLDKIALYDLKIKSLIMRIIRGKTVDELDAQFQDELEDEIRKVVSAEIFDRLFKTGEGTENTTKVSVVEVNISDIIIQ